MAKKKKKLEDICFPVPKNFSMGRSIDIDTNRTLKNHIFQQTLQVSYGLSIPYSFTSSYNHEEPYQLADDEQIVTVASLFQAMQPKDAIELALVQQFIILHLQAIKSAKAGLGDRDLKKLELTHQILETLLKYRSKGAQLIQVNYNHNQGQINNFKVVKNEQGPTTIEVKPDERSN